MDISHRKSLHVVGGPPKSVDEYARWRNLFYKYNARIKIRLDQQKTGILDCRQHTPKFELHINERKFCEVVIPTVLTRVWPKCGMSWGALASVLPGTMAFCERDCSILHACLRRA